MNFQERLQATYSMEWQGIRLRHAKPVNHSTETVRELIVGDGDPSYRDVFKWIEENSTGIMLGIRNINVTEETVAEFDRLFKVRNPQDTQ